MLGIDEAFADPQVRHLDMVTRLEHATDGTVAVLRHPVNLTETPTAVRRAASVPGADTEAVLAELGYDAEAIASLLASGTAAGSTA